MECMIPVHFFPILNPNKLAFKCGGVEFSNGKRIMNKEAYWRKIIETGTQKINL